MDGKTAACTLPSLLLLSFLWLDGNRCGAESPPAQDSAKALHGAAIRYESDGLQITGLLSKPEGAGPFPLVLVNHGGFEPAKSVEGFLGVFARNGFVALASDYRGCGSSEGKRELARGEVNDVLNAIRFAHTLPYVDSKRVAVWGFSHGAMIALLAASRDDTIRAVVAVQGPAELSDAWRHWVKNKDKPGVKPLAGLHLLVGGTPEQAATAWRERSPLYVADKITCPVLLVYSDGDRDDAVPTEHGRRMDAALRASGNTATTLMLLPDVNHGLDIPTWAKVMTPTLKFIRQHLERDDGPAQP